MTEDARVRTFGRRGLDYLKKNWLPVFSAFVIGLGIPMWRYFFVDKPVVHVEITQVDMDTPTKTVKVRQTDALKPVQELLGNQLYYLSADAIDIDELNTMVTSRRDAITNQQRSIAEVRKSIGELRARNSWTWGMLSDSSYAFGKSVTSLPEATPPKGPATTRETPIPKEALESWLSNVETALHRKEETNNESLPKIAAAIDSITAYKNGLNTTKAQITVHCATSNSGGGDIALKPQALLRAYLGGDNFIDVRMRIADYSTNGQLEAKKSRIIKVESDALETMSPKEQTKVVAYFKNSPPAQLFLIDIEGRTYSSNVVPFGSGLYDDKAYDTLRAAAHDESRPRISSAAMWSHER